MAVNIWEGAKADALIEAVANGQNGQKVDKQQGTNNAGKVLAIGSDGLVTPAYSIMPDAVKLALVNCFENVYWKNADGEQVYGKALKDALFSNAVDSRVIYEIPYGVIPGSLPFDTGVAARNDANNEDFTVLIKGTWVPNPKIAILLDAEGIDPSTGNTTGAMRIRSYVDSEGVHFRAWYKNGDQGDASTTGVDAAINHDIIIIVRNFSKHLFINTYVDGNLSCSYDNLVTDAVEVVGNYRINLISTIDGQPHPWTGTYELFKVFNVALSNQEINELVGTNITA